MGEHHPAWRTGASARRHDKCIAVIDSAPVGQATAAVLVDHGHRGDLGELCCPRSGGEATIDDEGSVAGVPHPLEGIDKVRPARKVDRDKFTHPSIVAGVVLICAVVNDAAMSSPLSGARLWVVGARPRTLPAAVVPVAVGAACAVALVDQDPARDGVVWWRVALAAVVSLALQVGVNYANDYSDGVRGTDDDRVGPLRLVGSGAASPVAVRRAAVAALGVAALAGAVLAIATSLWLLVVGVAAIGAAWGYTGGPRPYGYIGLGEVFVFVFFGLVATAGTTFAAVETIDVRSVVAGCGVGALACALLVVNNLRDIPTDTAAGKNTLAVRLGDDGTRRLYEGLIAAAVIAVVLVARDRPGALIALVAMTAGLRPWRVVRSGATGRDLIAVLGDTGRLQAVYGVLLTVGLVLPT